jgi:hypothetical protein
MRYLEVIKMEVATTPDIYCASIKDGTYVDYIPPIEAGSGLKCPCNACSHVYKSKVSFQTHVRSKSHQKWLLHLTTNQENYYREAIAGRVTIKTQQRMVCDLSQKHSVLCQQHLAASQRSAELSLMLAALQIGTTPNSLVDDLISFD